jgi:hypothetical protein
MDGLVEELLRLEKAKHRALVLIDPAAYDAGVRDQMRLIETNAKTTRAATNVEGLLALSQLITLNARLLQNLMETTPAFAMAGYSAAGRRLPPAVRGRLTVEA